MKISHLTITAAAALAISAAAGTTGIATAFAEAAQAAQAAQTNSLGSQAELENGDVVQAWTISDLKPSADPIPYAVHGTLWEATATDEAVRGSVIPIVSNLNARSAGGENYRVLFQVATPQGVNPGTLAQGQKTTGKIYFDVTGEAPTSVVYNDGERDLLSWSQTASAATTPRPAATGSGTSVSTPARTAPITPAAPASNAPATELAPESPAVAPTGTAPAAAPGAGAAATDIPGSTVPPPAEEGAPEELGAPLPQDTVSPGESVGTPLPAAVQQAPAAPAAPGAPAPEAPAPGALEAPAAPAPVAPEAPAAPVSPAPAAPADGSTTPTVPAGSDAPLTAGGIPTLVPAANAGVPTP